MNRTGAVDNEKISIWEKGRAVISAHKKEIIVMIAAFCFSKALIADRQSPFAYAFAVSVFGKSSPFALIGALLGYMGRLTDIDSIRFIAQTVVAAAVKWAFDSFFRKKGVLPVCALAGTLNLIAGIALILSPGQATVYDLLFLISETAICTGISYFSFQICRFEGLADICNAQNGRLYLAVFYCIGVLALSGTSIGFISFGHIVGMIFTMLISAQLGSGAGACIGLCTAVSLSQSVSDGFLVAALGLSGALSGLFSKLHRFVIAMIFCLSSAVAFVILSQNEQNVYLLYEIFSSAVIYLIIPDEVCDNIGSLLKNTGGAEFANTDYITKKLKFASQCVQEATESFDTLMDKMGKSNLEEIASVYKKTADRVCRRCNLKLSCWDTFYNDTMDDFTKLTPPLLKNGKVLCDNIPETLKKRCNKLPVLIADINSAYADFVNQKMAYQKLDKIRLLANERLRGMSNLLCEMSDELALTSCDAGLNEQVSKALGENRVKANDIYCIVDRLGRKSVEIYCKKDEIDISKAEKLKLALSKAAGAEFASFEITSSNINEKVSFFEKTPLEVEVDFFSLCAENETVCGDTFDFEKIQNGYFAAVLSDGMGRGKSAFNDSRITVSLVLKFLKLGFDAESLISLVNASLISKNQSESLSTLDMAIFDLFSGNVTLKKAGAATSYVKKGKKVYKIEASSMPLGILPQVSLQKKEFRLQSGDMLVLASDGLGVLGDDKTEQIIKGHQTDASLSKRLCFAAHAEASGKEQDDVTVACITLK